MSEETLTVSKPAWASKGVIGSVIVILVGLLGTLRIFIPALRDIEIDSGELAGVVGSALTLIFGAVALVGRVRAKSPIHIINRKSIPGAWNPDAVVVKGERVQGPKSKVQGFVRPVYLAVVVLILGLVWVVSAAVGQTTWRASRYDGAAQDCGGMSYDAWMRFVPVVDGRPFLVRLWDSVRVKFSPYVTLRDGQLAAGVSKFELKGGTDF